MDPTEATFIIDPTRKSSNGAATAEWNGTRGAAMAAQANSAQTIGTIRRLANTAPGTTMLPRAKFSPVAASHAITLVERALRIQRVDVRRAAEPFETCPRGMKRSLVAAEDSHSPEERHDTTRNAAIAKEYWNPAPKTDKGSDRVITAAAKNTAFKGEERRNAALLRDHRVIIRNALKAEGWEPVVNT
jgi:hypothetical protein